MPDQFARTSTGPRCWSSPASTWLLYCQTASATTIGASGWMPANTSRPRVWLSMKPCSPVGVVTVPWPR